MRRSFRRRVAMLLALLAGAALAGFAVFAGWSIRDARLARLNAELRLHLLREVPPQTRDTGQWRQTETALAQALAGGDRNKLLLLALDDEGTVRYRSPHMPDDFRTKPLPWPAVAAGRPPRPLPPDTDGANDARGGRPADRYGRPPPFPGRPGPEFDFRRGLPPPAAPPPRIPPSLNLTKLTLASGPWHVGLAALPDSRVAIAVHGSAIDAEMAPVQRAFLVAIPFALLLIGLGAWILSGRALRPVRRLTDAIQGVTARGLDRRLDAQDLDREFGKLVTVFNDMLGRLQRSFTQASRFSADAAHELKTPLAILQGQVERAIGLAPNGSPLQAALSDILDETRRLSAITRKLLLLAQADAGRLRLQTDLLDLTALLRELSEDARLLAPSLRIETEIAGGLALRADRDLVLQVLHNLVSNAIKYNVPDGWLRIAARPGKDRIEIRVENASNDALPPDRNKPFERFYRADSAHSRKVDGLGLGLSVAREIARAHGGDLQIAPSAAGRATFLFSLPKEPAAS